MAVLAVAVVAGGSWWAYFKFGTVEPPKLDQPQTTVEKVTEYFGDPRAFARLSVPEREEFLIKTVQRFSSPEDREALNRSFARMSPTEKSVFVDATFEVVKTRVVEAADEFNRQKSPAAKAKFVEDTFNRFQAMKGDLGGGGSANTNLGEPFKGFMPNRSDELSKMLVTRTTATERSKARPFIDALSKRYEQKKQAERR